MIDAREVTRRDFVKGAAVVAAMLPFGGLLAGCASDAPEPVTGADAEPAADDAASATDGAAPEDAQASSPDSLGATKLVAYFSATGNTERVANMIADHLGADVFAIEPVEPYTADDLDYNDSSSRASRERADPNRAVELVRIAPDGFANYDIVFLGYPIWWGDASWAIGGFVRSNDFTGKTVVPFCTSGSSPIGSSADNLAAIAQTGTWADGRRFGSSASADDVASWVDGLAL